MTASCETETRRMSAGTAAPSSRMTISPGTRSPASIILVTPSRTTVHCGTERDASAEMARSAFHSCDGRLWWDARSVWRVANHERACGESGYIMGD